MDENMNFEINEDTQKNRYLIFSIGEEEYGIEIKYVTEIIGIQSITEIPEQPYYVKGIINLRGKIIPVIDARLRLRKEIKEYNDRTCIIVIDIKSVSIGVIIDEVVEVLSMEEEDVVLPPELSKGGYNHYVKGIGKVDEKVKLILDCERLIGDREMEFFQETV